MSHYCCKTCGLRYDDCRCAAVGMTESTQQPDMSKSAQEVDTFAAIRKALSRFRHENGKAHGHLDDWQAYEDACDPTTIAALLAAADRAKELEADARRYRWLRTIGAMVPGTAYRWSYRDELDAAIDRAQGEQHAG